MVEISRLFWKKAFTSDNVLLGEVESAELDTDSWHITNFYVGLSDEAAKKLGFRHPFLGKTVICLPVSEVKTFQDVAILNKTMAELQDLKQCKE